MPAASFMRLFAKNRNSKAPKLPLLNTKKYRRRRRTDFLLQSYLNLPSVKKKEEMGSTLFSSCLFSFKFHSPSLGGNFKLSQQMVSSKTAVTCSLEKGCGTTEVNADSKVIDEESKQVFGFLGRRGVIIYGFSLISAVLSVPRDVLAVKQGLLAGRIPGLSEPDEKASLCWQFWNNLRPNGWSFIRKEIAQTGWRTYRRPDDKSGGHGVGWSPIIPYTFKVPQGWEEVPVSIADLGGTEIDLRFASSQEGRLFVVVAPVRRFADLGENAEIEEIGPPEKVIDAFGPEVIGENVEGKILSMAVTEHSGRTYYQYELEPPHALITATAAGNRLYLFSITGSGLQWKRHYKNLKQIADSFRVV